MGISISILRVAAMAAGTFFFSAAPTLAQSQADSDDCFSIGTDNYKDSKFYDVGLSACDRFIKSGKYSGRDLMPYVRQRADWYRRKGELSQALRDFGWAIELDPNDVENYDFRGDVFVEQGEYTRAIEDYNTAIRIKPNYPPAYYARGQAYEKLGRKDDAISSYRRAISLTIPDDAQPNTKRLYEWGINEARRRLRELER